MVTAVDRSLRECNLNREQCLEEYRSGRYSENYHSDCYEMKDVFGGLKVLPCVEICDPQTKISQHILKCEDYCEGE